ncbi:AmmeMemoRadiSam system protein B, partial [bacterium]|nr:AmmeMemoRadiSam system protein B [bacterium]
MKYKLLLITSILCVVFLMTKESFGSDKIRKPVVSGMFYDADPKKLEKQVKVYISNASVPEIQGRPVTFFAPHAGYVYSGSTAGYTYKLLEKIDFKTIVIIALSHKYPLKKASFYDGDAYQTPLGNIEIDRDITSILRQSSLFEFVPAAHTQEHSLEVQLPFLQVIKKDVKIVPILLSYGSYDYLKQLSSYLANIIKDKNIPVLISTDMSHYHQKKSANLMDKEALDIIKNLEPEKLYKKINSRECELCGSSGAVVGMMIAQNLGAKTVEILNYSDSGDITGDTSQVVGYFSGVIYKKEGETKEVSLRNESEGLTESDKKKLLEIARSSMESAVKGEKSPSYKINKDSILNKKRGGFVTLTIDGELRGCIGYIKAVKSLADTVAEMAKAASLEDNRF